MNESLEHHQAKREFAGLLERFGNQVEIEYAVPALYPNGKPRILYVDVALPVQRIGFEIEKSPGRKGYFQKRREEAMAGGWQLVRIDISRFTRDGVAAGTDARSPLEAKDAG